MATAKVERCTYQINWLNCNNINKWEDTCYTKDTITYLYNEPQNILEISNPNSSVTVRNEANNGSYTLSASQNSKKEYDLSKFTRTTSSITNFFSSNGSAVYEVINFPSTANLESINNFFDGLTNCTNINTKNVITDKVKSAYYVFYNCKKITSLDLYHWNTENITDFYYAFYDCSSLREIKGIENWRFPNLTNMNYIFVNTKLERLNLSLWGITNKLRYINSAFSGTTASVIDISNWDLSNVDSYEGLFRYCSNLKEIYMNNVKLKSTFGTNNYVLQGCTNLERIYVCGCSNETKQYIQNALNKYSIKAELVDAYKTDTWRYTPTTQTKSIDSGLATIQYKEYLYLDCDGNEKEWRLSDEYTILDVDYNTNICTIENILIPADDIGVDLNDQWQLLTANIPYPSTLNEGYILESFSNWHSTSSTATRAKMKIIIKNQPNFKLWYRSDASSSYNYTIVGNLDTTLSTSVVYNSSGVKAHSRSNQNTWRSTDYPNDGGEHFIEVVYYKSSTNQTGFDRGFIYLPNFMPLTKVTPTLSPDDKVENEIGGQVCIMRNENYVVPKITEFYGEPDENYKIISKAYPDYSFGKWIDEDDIEYQEQIKDFNVGNGKQFYGVFNQDIIHQTPIDSIPDGTHRYIKIDFNNCWEISDKVKDLPTTEMGSLLSSRNYSYDAYRSLYRFTIRFSGYPVFKLWYCYDGYTTTDDRMGIALSELNTNLPNNCFTTRPSSVKYFSGDLNWYEATYETDGGENFIQIGWNRYYSNSGNKNCCFIYLPNTYVEDLWLPTEDIYCAYKNKYSVLENKKRIYGITDWEYNDERKIGYLLEANSPDCEEQFITIPDNNWEIDNNISPSKYIENTIPFITKTITDISTFKIIYKNIPKLKVWIRLDYETHIASYQYMGYMRAGEVDISINNQKRLSTNHDTWSELIYETDPNDGKEHFIEFLYEPGSYSEMCKTRGSIAFEGEIESENYILTDDYYCINGDKYEKLVSEKVIVLPDETRYIFTDMNHTKVGSLIEENSEDCQIEVDLNDQWQPLTENIELPYGIDGSVYESFSNYHQNNGVAKMRITFSNPNFKLWYRSDSEVCCDYVVLSKIDTELPTSVLDSSTQVQYNTKDKGKTWYEAIYENDGGKHFIEVVYRKDGSVNTEPDKGFILIPSKIKGERWTLVENDYICNGGNKYQKLAEEYTYDNTHWFETGKYKMGNLIEASATECNWIQLRMDTPKGTPITGWSLDTTKANNNATYLWVFLGTTPDASIPSDDGDWSISGYRGGNYCTGRMRINGSESCITSAGVDEGNGVYTYDFGRTLYLIGIQQYANVDAIKYKTL